MDTLEHTEQVETLEDTGQWTHWMTLGIGHTEGHWTVDTVEDTGQVDTLEDTGKVATLEDTGQVETLEDTGQVETLEDLDRWTH